MQYLLIEKTDTLTSVSKIVGSQNIDALLAENGLERTPKIGQQWASKCDSLVQSDLPDVTAARKTALLNSLTGSEDTFEKACLMDEDEWKIFSSLGAFKDALRIPETVSLPNSARIIGDSVCTTVVLGSGVGTSGSSSGRSADTKYGGKSDNVSTYAGAGSNASASASGSRAGSSSSSSSSSSINGTNRYATGNIAGGGYYITDNTGSGSYSGSNSKSAVTGSEASPTGTGTYASTKSSVDSMTYRAVMTDLKTTGTINPGVLNSVNVSPAVTLGSNGSTQSTSGVSVNPIPGNLPWGKIQIYSSLLGTSMDIPAYPEELETGRNANYSTMPDIIYQYEPWIVYQSSGPREQSITFHLHRDMWSGNHLDGKANELIRFCEANTFPRYSGAAVLAPQVRIYINGSLFVSGVLTNSHTRWTGPIGQDGWFLEFELSLTIQEVSPTALNIDTVSKFGLIG